MSGMYRAYTSAAPSTHATPIGSRAAAPGAPTMMPMPRSESTRATTFSRVSGSVPRTAAMIATHAGYV